MYLVSSLHVGHYPSWALDEPWAVGAFALNLITELYWACIVSLVWLIIHLYIRSVCSNQPETIVDWHRKRCLYRQNPAMYLCTYLHSEFGHYVLRVQFYNCKQCCPGAISNFSHWISSNVDTWTCNFLHTGPAISRPAYSDTCYSDTVRRWLLTVTLFQIPDWPFI